MASNADFGLLAPNQAVSVSLRLNGRLVPSSQTTSFPSESGNLVTGVSGGAGSAVFNTGAGPHYLKLVNKTLNTIKFVAANINIMQIG